MNDTSHSINIRHAKLSAAPVSILCAEDDAEARKLLCSIIQNIFPELLIYEAEDGRAGLDLYAEHPCDIVITDINMPKVNGLDMVRQIKTSNPNALIIALTAYSDTSYLLDSIEIGINHYIIKPLDHKNLMQAIQKCIDTITLKNAVAEKNEHIRKLSLAVERSPHMVVITNAEGKIEYVNARFCEISGYKAEDMLNATLKIFDPHNIPAAVYENLWETLKSGMEWRGEFLNRKKSGVEYWENTSISPIMSNTGEITHLLVILEEITERKHVEQQINDLNAMLAKRATELESKNLDLEAFNYSVSHDLRSPLTAINGFTQVIMQKCTQLDDQCKTYLHEIYDSTLEMKMLIDTLLNFSRLSQADMQITTLNLSDMAREIAQRLRAKAPDRQVEFHIADRIQVQGDKNLLRIVLENLLGNAWKFTGKNKNTLIEVGVSVSRGKTTYFVRDNGIGFNSEDADKIFSPFKRLTKSDEFEGSGIGLATVQRIIYRHGGEVWAAGEPGKGTTIRFTIPASNRKALHARKSPVRQQFL